jgi:uncharacterized protein
VKLSLFPQENKSLDLLTEMAGQIPHGVTTLSEILGASADDYDRLAEELHQHDAKVFELHFALMTHVRTSFITPLPREDLFQISRYIVEAYEKLDGAAELIALNRVKRLSTRASEQLEVIARMSELTRDAMGRLSSLLDLDEYYVEMLRLAKRAERTHRNWTAEAQKELKTPNYLRHRDVANQLVEVTKDLRRVSNHVGQILIKES